METGNNGSSTGGSGLQPKVKKPPVVGESTMPKRPSPKELVDYYRSKGLDQQAANEKVIDDLQKALALSFQRFSSSRAKEEKTARLVSGNLESFSERLSVLETKLDSKPDFPGVFVAGVSAGAFLRATFQGIPHVWGACTQIARSWKHSTKA